MGVKAVETELKPQEQKVEQKSDKELVIDALRKKLDREPTEQEIADHMVMAEKWKVAEDQIRSILPLVRTFNEIFIAACRERLMDKQTQKVKICDFVFRGQIDATVLTQIVAIYATELDNANDIAANPE